MAEILLFGYDKHHSDPIIDAQAMYKRGDIVIVRPDGHPWGSKEGLPDFVLLKLPGVAVKNVLAYCQPKEGELFVYKNSLEGEPSAEFLEPPVKVSDWADWKGRRIAKYYGKVRDTVVRREYKVNPDDTRFKKQMTLPEFKDLVEQKSG